MGVDPAGMGKNETVWAVRDRFRASVVATEKLSESKSIAEKTMTLAHFYGVLCNQVFIDNFGIGANVAVELAGAGFMPKALNVGDSPSKENETVYINLRAEAYWELKQWLRSGGELVGDRAKWEQLLTLRYRRELSGKLKIMSKDDMGKEGLKSPDRADALMLTFTEPEVKVANMMNSIADCDF